MVAKLREHTDYLLEDIRAELAADKEAHGSRKAVLTSWWLAWRLSLGVHELSGAQSFGWVKRADHFIPALLASTQRPLSVVH